MATTTAAPTDGNSANGQQDPAEVVTGTGTGSRGLGKYNETVVRYSRWALAKVFFLNNYDITRIYKMQRDKSLRVMQQTGPGQPQEMKQSLSDRRRQVLGKLMLLLLTYFLLKTLIIISVNYLLHKLSRRWRHDTNRLSCPTWWPDCRESLLAISGALGDPLGELGGESIFFAGGLSCCLYIVLAIMPYYFTTNTLDLASIRFYFEPQRELLRLDHQIGLRLDELLESLLNYKMRQLRGLNGGCLDGGWRPNDLGSFNWRLVDQNLRQLISYRCQAGLQTLRPVYFNETNRMKALIEAAWLVVGLYAIFFWWMFFLIVPVVNVASRAKCRTLKLSECSIFVAFTPQEMIYLFEINVACWLLYISFMLHMITALILLKSNLRLVAGMRHDLVQCLEQLQRHNLIQETFASGRHQLEKVECKLMREQTIDRCLLEAAIKILVASDELKRGTKGVTQFLAPIFAASLVVTGLAVIVNGMSFQSFQKQILITYWLMINTFALISASILSQFSQLERIYWSIHAELMIRSYDLVARESFIAIVWRRLSNYSRSTKHLCTAKPLCIGLTYKRIIEINFSIISLVSLLLLSR